jgi:hypothetical protein
MRACAAGTATSWAAAFAAVVLFPKGTFKVIILTVALSIAASFTVLLIAHLIRFMTRLARQPAAESEALEPRIGRRLAMLRLGQAALATAVVGGTLFLPRKVAAQALCNCQYQCFVVCHAGDTQAYDRCYCRDDNGNSCGPGYTDTPTGSNTCPG